ncbi:hypothetical protein PFICI_10539 [Pestalotiopsis fici W106-1]|uniref:Uncharacterized protein n=1 Tax=Pestalotiopsis fici (strain W106-1 / CGMCC3.15140) TaxID=1229662 RepID=W3WZB8_PESFW|nr:uncharacterized protein PFICI_10539 [Pestalotiopsis fici W106-1]ETS78477.1 hypothetical protein PFICI_10539 [Pestalotiopsis fici W106-1]
MSKNGDIRGFFGKKASQTSRPDTSSASQLGPEPKQATKPAPVAASELWLDSPDLPSSPITPQKNVTKTPRARDTEIKGSDDEDDDSDSSFESIGAMLGRGRNNLGAASQNVSAGFMTTPKAKRIARGGFHRSPLTLQQQPKHKFDFKTLLNHVKQDNAFDESVRRAEAAMAEAEEELEPVINPDKMAGEAMAGEDESKIEKLAKAIDRTTGDESRPRAYFFDFEEPPRDLKKKPFPKKSVKAKPWSILQTESSRNQMFIHGLPTTLARKGKELPDELYLWILDQVCVENDAQLRNQYIELASSCIDDTNRLVTAEKLYGMLETLGGAKYSDEGGKLPLSPGLQNPYPGRDWAPLRYFLELLTRMARNLNTETNLDAIKMLLRLGLDPIIVTMAGLQVAHSTALLELISALPAAPARWEYCCKSICDYLYTSVEQASQRSFAISMLPTSIPPGVDLQRRLASEALLNEPNLGAKDPGQSVTIHDIFDRMSEPDFQITNSTDFGELIALVTLLDIVIHDGTHLYRAQLALSTSTAPEDEARSHYDADIDRIVVGLKILHDKISDNTLILKKEVKLSLDGMMKRLKNTVRSCPPPKITIFDDDKAEKEDKFLPRQKDFMKKWTAAKKSAVEE